MRKLTLIAIALLSVVPGRSEDLLKKDDAELLGKQISSSRFQTCTKVDIDLEKIKPYRIEKTDRSCPRDRIDSFEYGRRHREEIQAYESFKRDHPKTL